jgi:hypothetical protein
MIKGLFCLLIFLLWAGSAFGQNYIQAFETGEIDWSNGIVEAVGIGRAPAESDNPAQSRAIAKSRAETSARSHLYDLIGKLQVDSEHNIKALIERQEVTVEALRESLSRCRVVDMAYLEGGSVKATVAFGLNGAFADLVLPKDIKVIEPVLQPERPEKASDAPSGLVVHCDGFPVEPAMAPSIVDEEEQVVYGSAYASRDHAVEWGMVSYGNNFDAVQNNPRVAPRPLRVKGIRTTKTGPCDIVISNADAAKIRGSASNLMVMQRCRVIIVLE